MNKYVKILLTFIISTFIFTSSISAADKYNVRFNNNGGTGNMKNISCKIDKNCQLSANTFKKDKYIFVGWNTKKDGSGKTYTDSQKVKNLAKKNKTVKLYAVWEPVYTIVFNSNGATSGKMNNQTCIYNSKCMLSKNIFKKDGFVFAYWNTKSNGKGTTYTDLSKVKKLAKKGKKITLYAIWKKGYTIIFDGNDADFDDMEDQECVYDKKCKLAANTITKEGYIFNGWNTKSNGKGNKYKNKQKVKNITKKGKTIVLYAQWKPITYTIKFNSNGYAMKKLTSVTCTYEKWCDLPDIPIFKDDKVYDVKWSMSKDNYENVDTYKLTSTNNKTIIVYAMHTEYYSDFYSGNNTFDGDNYPYITKEGYSLAGWYDENGNKVTTKDMVINYDKKYNLSSRWKPNTYSINYYLNGGINNPENPISYQSDDINVTLKNPVREGYKFTGWYEDFLESYTHTPIDVKCNYRIRKINIINTNIYNDRYIYANWEKE